MDDQSEADEPTLNLEVIIKSHEQEKVPCTPLWPHLDIRSLKIVNLGPTSIIFWFIVKAFPVVF